MEDEYLVTLKLKNGKTIDMYRTKNKDVVLDDDGNRITLPRASGRLTLDIVSLLDIEKVEEDR